MCKVSSNSNRKVHPTLATFEWTATVFLSTIPLFSLLKFKCLMTQTTIQSAKIWRIALAVYYWMKVLHHEPPTASPIQCLQLIRAIWTIRRQLDTLQHLFISTCLPQVSAPFTYSLCTLHCITKQPTVTWQIPATAMVAPVRRWWQVRNWLHSNSISTMHL